MILSEQQSLQCIIQLFDSLFLDTENTQLIGGADEPLYIPSSSKKNPHQLIFRENFVSSALHVWNDTCVIDRYFFNH